MLQVMMREALDASLSTLDARERIVMRMRYGLDDGSPRTLEDIGKYFKVRARTESGSCFIACKAAKNGHGKSWVLEPNQMDNQEKAGFGQRVQCIWGRGMLAGSPMAD